MAMKRKAPKKVTRIIKMVVRVDSRLQRDLDKVKAAMSHARLKSESQSGYSPTTYLYYELPVHN